MNYNKKFKIIIVGDTNTGKTTFIRNYLNYDIRYLSTTIALEYYFTEKYYFGSLIKINFCDISGNKNYFNISKNYLSNTDGIIMIYDINKKETIDNLYLWKKCILENNKEIENKILIIGNKNNNYLYQNKIVNYDNENENDNKINNLFTELPKIDVLEYKIDIYKEKNNIKKIVDDYIDNINEKYNKKINNNLENNNLENNKEMININLIEKNNSKKCCIIS
jgi:small GTP-binding protein